MASGLLLTDGFLNLHGWQWLFLLEGLPTICLGIWVSHKALAPRPLQFKCYEIATTQC